MKTSETPKNYFLISSANINFNNFEATTLGDERTCFCISFCICECPGLCMWKVIPV